MRDVVSDLYLDSYNDTSTSGSSLTTDVRGYAPPITSSKDSSSKDLACSITGLYGILGVITDQGSGGLGNTPCRGQQILTHTFPS